jgi:outer membrane protein X
VKKIILISFAFLAFNLAVQAQTRLGVMAGYGGRFSSPALGGTGEFFVTDDISLSPSILHYFPVSRNNTTRTWLELNFDGHYYLYYQDIFQFYALGGLNYTAVRFKNKTDGSLSYTEGRLNVNLGGGINFDFGEDYMPFSEIKYTLGTNNQIVVVAGIKFTIN